MRSFWTLNRPLPLVFVNLWSSQSGSNLKGRHSSRGREGSLRFALLNDKSTVIGRSQKEIIRQESMKSCSLDLSKDH